MNIFALKNHIKFEKIFSNARENGKISWLKLSSFKDLPDDFVEQYYDKLKPYGIEKNQHLTDDMITLHRDDLNWYSIIKYQSMSEDCIRENIEIIKKLRLWYLLFKFQKLSLDFLLEHLEEIRSDERMLDAIQMNGQITKEDKDSLLKQL